MRPESGGWSDGLDVSLLGVIVAGVAYYAGGFADVPDTTPRLVRFADAGPGYVPVAAMPQESALLLLLGSGGPGTAGPAATGSPWSLVVVAGLMLVVAGPVWAWMGRGDD